MKTFALIAVQNWGASKMTKMMMAAWVAIPVAMPMLMVNSAVAFQRMWQPTQLTTLPKKQKVVAYGKNNTNTLTNQEKEKDNVHIHNVSHVLLSTWLTV